MKKTEKEQMISNSYLEAIIDSLPFEVWLKDTDGNYVFVNKSFEEHDGKSKEKIVGSNDCNLFSKTEADIYVDSEKVFDQFGKLIGNVGFSIGITYIKEMRNALFESERSKSALLANLPGFAYHSKNNHDLTMTFISEGCYDLTGYTAEELLGMKPSYYDLIDPKYSGYLLEKWRDIAPSNSITPDEYPITTASGEIKWVWEQYRDVFDSDQNFIYTEGFITDITERKITEKALKQSEERFRTMFEEAPLGMGIFDSLNGIAYQANARFSEIVGRTKEQILLIDWKDYSHPDDVEENLKRLELMNSHKITGFNMDKRYIKPDGSVVWVNMTVAPFKYEDNSNSHHLCMVEDITERKRTEEEILYLSFHDQLTGLYNRRFYEEELKRLDTKRNLPMTLVMGDANELKLINDFLGHAMGDDILRKIAEVLQKECRADDIIARIGGDEFVILLPKTDAFETEKIIKRINEQLLKEKVGTVSVSISFGYETKNNEEEKIEEIFNKAEDKMYKRKQTKSQRMKGTAMSALFTTLYNKNKREEQHCHRVSQLCEGIAIALKLPEYEIVKLKMIALFHDIGKVVIDENILNKPGKLTDSEWVEIKRHSETGYKLLSTANDMSDMAGCVLAHHERWDGKGYPKGLKEEEIPLMSRIIAIADSYDAMTSERSYKEELSQSEAIEEIRKNAGTQFDANIAKIFIEKVLGVKSIGCVLQKS